MATQTMLWANNASTTLASPITNTSVTLQVASGTGILFPQPTTNQYFMATINDVVNNIIEIVQVNSVVGDTFYITRGQERSAPQAFNAGVKVSNRITAGTLQYLAGLTSGVDNAELFNQTSPSTSWTINHNLNKYPNIHIYDSNGNYVITDVFYNSLNTLTANFAIATAGMAYLS